MSGLTLVTLKNGTQVARGVVSPVMRILNDLIQRDRSAFIELVALARDPQHELVGDTAKVVRDTALVDPSGRIHDSYRNIVLSAIEGEGQEMVLISPLRE
ncbi:MAG: hypothetical protein M3380_12900 [Chloroflexota bacterium]|nr:hypothetical protein [Chloroflexota bacterium]